MKDEPGATARRNLLIAMAIGVMLAIALVVLFTGKVAKPAAGQRPSPPPLSAQG
ncbi:MULTISPECIES: hypothetical protein [unclassified Sphingomonas]|uniref:hypothetical protein n=1 Tax=unclassified Sphingomonas TaxID=196159 RepID=UPI00226A6439|nr:MULTISPECIES: hypothetical protein [unclassified Sphingomonas]